MKIWTTKETTPDASRAKFKATKWQDYAGIGEGLVSEYMKSKKKERKDPVSRSRRIR